MLLFCEDFLHPIKELISPKLPAQRIDLAKCLSFIVITPHLIVLLLTSILLLLFSSELLLMLGVISAVRAYRWLVLRPPLHDLNLLPHFVNAHSHLFSDLLIQAVLVPTEALFVLPCFILTLRDLPLVFFAKLCPHQTLHQMHAILQGSQLTRGQVQFIEEMRPSLAELGLYQMVLVGKEMLQFVPIVSCLLIFEIEHMLV